MSRRLTFAELARLVLQQFQSLSQKQVEEIEEKFLADVLLNCLRQERYLLVIDNLETLLHSSGEWQDIFYEQFFLRWLECDSKSVLLVTTQERPKLPETKPRWLKLLGLKSSEGAALLQVLGIQGTQAELETFSEAVNGCPLTLRLVAGLLNVEEGEKPPLSCLSQYGEALGVEGLHRGGTTSTEQILEISSSRLSEKLRQLLFNLSVYRLPFDVAAAVAQLPGEEVTERDLKELERRSLLLRQRDKGGELRFQFQPMILKYARRKAGDLTAAHQRAIGYYDSRKKENKTWQTLDDLTEWLELFHYKCELKEYASASDILYFCDDFLTLRGYPNKRRELFQQSLAIEREIGDRSGEAKSLDGLGSAYRFLGQYREAISSHQKSLAIQREIGDRAGEAGSLNGLGLTYDSLGQYREAIAFYEQSLVIFREIGDRAGEASSLNHLGRTYDSLGQPEKAIAFSEQSLVIFREIGDRGGEASSLKGLGDAYHSLGKYRGAIAFHEQSLAISREIDDLVGEASSLNNLGRTYDSLGQPGKAIAFYEQSLAIKREIGDRRGQANSLRNLALVYYQTGRIGEGYAVAYQSNQILKELELPLDAYSIPNWMKPIARFAQRGNLQLAICCVAAFPFALIWCVLLALWRLLRIPFRQR
jgi:tetratricopeptide (TPR) repeat protein